MGCFWHYGLFLGFMFSSLAVNLARLFSGMVSLKNSVDSDDLWINNLNFGFYPRESAND